MNCPEVALVEITSFENCFLSELESDSLINCSAKSETVQSKKRVNKIPTLLVAESSFHSVC